MLPGSDAAEITHLLRTLPCRIAVPDWYQGLLNRRGEMAGPADDRRAFTRFYYPTKALLKYRGNLPSLSRPLDPYIVLCRDLSRSGVGFLHEEPIYPSEEVLLWLPTGCRTYSVRRCVRHNEKCYEIGAQ